MSNIDMRTLYILLIFLFVTCACDTENNVDPRFTDYFIKYYGEEGNQTGVDVQKLADGFIILGNSTAGNGNTQIFLTRVDQLGNELWSNYFGGPWTDKAAALQVDLAGNYIIAATVEAFGADRDVMLLKVNPAGIKIDSAVFGAPGEDDVAKSVIVTREGDYILTGYTTNVDTSKPGYSSATDFEDIYSIRTTADLVPFEAADWRQVYGFPGVDRGVEVKQKDDGSFLFFGTTDKPPTSNSQQGGLNMFLFPAGADGIANSSSPLQLFGTLSNETASEIIQTSEGAFAMLGTSTKTTLSKPFLVRVRNNNSFLSSGMVGTAANVEGASLTAAAADGLIMSGRILGNDNTSIYIARLTNDGSVMWEQTFGGLDSDMPGRILELEDQSIVFVGTVTLESQSKVCLIKITDKGELKP